MAGPVSVEQGRFGAVKLEVSRLLYHKQHVVGAGGLGASKTGSTHYTHNT